MGFRALVTILVSLSLCPAQVAEARQPVAEWLASEWKAAQQLPDLGGKGFRYKTEMYAVLSAAELRALESQVQNKPEHPRRHELLAEKGRAARGPDVFRTCIFSDGAGWRYSFDSSSRSFIDAALTGSQAWQLTQDSLSLADPLAARDHQNPQTWIAGHESVFVLELGSLLHGGFSMGRVSQVVPGPIHVRDNRWSFEAAAPQMDGDGRPLFAVEFKGRWDDSAQRGFVESCIITRHTDKKHLGSTTRYVDWKLAPELGLWVASRAEEVDPKGKVWRAIVFDGVLETRKSFVELTQAPSPGWADPLRPLPNLTAVADYRTGTLTRTREDGTEDSVALPGVERQASLGWIKAAGWILAVVCVVATAVWIRLRN